MGCFQQTGQTRANNSWCFERGSACHAPKGAAARCCSFKALGRACWSGSGSSLRFFGGPSMPIPDFQTLMLPFLQATSGGAEHTNHEIEMTLAKQYGLTEAELQQMLPSGKKVFASRVAWAKAYLKHAGLLDSPPRGPFRIAAEGQKVLEEQPPPA